MKTLLAIVVLLGLTGCESPFFSEHGTMSSTGSWRNTWQWHPQGCTRDPFDGQPVSKTKSVLTLLWENPGLRDVKLSNPNWSPDAPLRLEFEASGPADDVVATLHTIDNGGILLDKRACTVLKLQTTERPAVQPGGRPTLSGDVDLDCRANESHIVAKVSFERCEY
jgi:hypothetical protein